MQTSVWVFVCPKHGAAVDAGAQQPHSNPLHGSSRGVPTRTGKWYSHAVEHAALKSRNGAGGHEGGALLSVPHAAATATTNNEASVLT